LIIIQHSNVINNSITINVYVAIVKSKQYYKLIADRHKPLHGSLERVVG